MEFFKPMALFDLVELIIEPPDFIEPIDELIDDLGPPVLRAWALSTDARTIALTQSAVAMKARPLKSRIK